MTAEKPRQRPFRQSRFAVEEGRRPLQRQTTTKRQPSTTSLLPSRHQIGASSTSSTRETWCDQASDSTYLIRHRTKEGHSTNGIFTTWQPAVQLGEVVQQRKSAAMQQGSCYGPHTILNGYAASGGEATITPRLANDATAIEDSKRNLYCAGSNVEAEHSTSTHSLCGLPLLLHTPVPSPHSLHYQMATPSSPMDTRRSGS